MDDTTDNQDEQFDEVTNEGGDEAEIFGKILYTAGRDQSNVMHLGTPAGHGQAMADKVLKLLGGAGLFIIALIWSFHHFGHLDMIESIFGSVTTLVGTIAGYMLRSLKAP